MFEYFMEFLEWFAWVVMFTLVIVWIKIRDSE